MQLFGIRTDLLDCAGALFRMKVDKLEQNTGSRLRKDKRDGGYRTSCTIM